MPVWNDYVQRVTISSYLFAVPMRCKIGRTKTRFLLLTAGVEPKPCGVVVEQPHIKTTPRSLAEINYFIQKLNVGLHDHSTVERIQFLNQLKDRSEKLQNLVQHRRKFSVQYEVQSD